MVNPTSVSVLADGSDGEAAIVRVIGQHRAHPLSWRDSLGNIFGDFDVELAQDFVLEPGAEYGDPALLVCATRPVSSSISAPSSSPPTRSSASSTPVRASWSPPEAGIHGQRLTTTGWGSSAASGASRGALPEGQLEFALEQSGFSLVRWPGHGRGGVLHLGRPIACRLIAGGPLLRRASRRDTRVDLRGSAVDARSPARVTDSDGRPDPQQHAYVHELDGEQYLSRTITDDEGRFTDSRARPSCRCDWSRSSAAIATMAGTLAAGHRRGRHVGHGAARHGSRVTATDAGQRREGCRCASRSSPPIPIAADPRVVRRARRA